jgi:hypothetical protein
MSQSADSGNWLAAILLIVGISFLLEFKQISSSMPISLSANDRKPIAATNS